MRSAVLLIIYKREATTKRVFERIKEAQPPRLYIAANAPNPQKEDDEIKCLKARQCTENVDWQCDVKRWYRDTHLTAGESISSAISWFFENEEEGIIIEDDILAHPDFFKYCDEMLDRYREDERIHLIAGRNSFFYSIPEHQASYFFSRYMMIWGWASWRRVWNTYQYDLSKISKKEFSEKLKQIDYRARPFMRILYKLMLTKKFDTWDHQFFVNQILYSRYSIIPFTNMVENLGMGSPEATHSSSDLKRTNHKAESPYPLYHPEIVKVDEDVDYVHAKNEGIISPNRIAALWRKFKFFMLFNVKYKLLS